MFTVTKHCRRHLLLLLWAGALVSQARSCCTPPVHSADVQCCAQCSLGSLLPPLPRYTNAFMALDLPTSGEQASGALIPLQRRCSWKYESLSLVEQQNIQACYSDTYNDYVASKAYEDKLFNDVYPVLVRFMHALM